MNPRTTLACLALVLATPSWGVWSTSRDVDGMTDEVRTFAYSSWAVVDNYPWKAKAQIQIGYSCTHKSTWVGIKTGGAGPARDFVTRGHWASVFTFRFDSGSPFVLVSRANSVADDWHRLGDRGRALLFGPLANSSRVLVRTETSIAGEVTWTFSLRGSAAAIDSLPALCGKS